MFFDNLKLYLGSLGVSRGMAWTIRCDSPRDSPQGDRLQGSTPRDTPSDPHQGSPQGFPPRELPPGSPPEIHLGIPAPGDPHNGERKQAHSCAILFVGFFRLPPLGFRPHIHRKQHYPKPGQHKFQIGRQLVAGLTKLLESIELILST